MSSQPLANRHPKYYFPVGTDVFRVENTLYKLHRDVLMEASTVFNDMFITGRPPAGSKAIDGQSDIGPIVLETIKAKDFNHLLSWLYPYTNRVDDPHSFDRYVSIYQLACHWEISAAKQYAKAGLDSLPAEKRYAAKMLQFSRQHDLDDWFASAFRELVGRNLATFSFLECERIGFKAMIIIARTRENLQLHRRQVARFPPPMSHSAQCSEDRQAACIVAYENLWWKTVGKRLLDPQYSIPTLGIPGVVDRLAVTGVNPECWAMTKDNIINHKFDACLESENRIIDDAIGMLRSDEELDVLNESGAA